MFGLRIARSTLQLLCVEFGCFPSECNMMPPPPYGCRAANSAGTDFELDLMYEMIEPIGHGSYGVVISALDYESNSKVHTIIRVG